MNQILNIVKNDYFLIALLAVNILLIVLFIANTIATKKTRNAYKTMINKLGKHTDIEDSLKNYLDKVERIDENCTDIKNYCKNVENEITKCIKKVGIVRYSAFRDVGSDLSFALALLDENNNGVVLNGIYSVENSNIYAKPIENGKSTYSISEEEQQAINKAIENN